MYDALYQSCLFETNATLWRDFNEKLYELVTVTEGKEARRAVFEQFTSYSGAQIVQTLGLQQYAQVQNCVLGSFSGNPHLELAENLRLERMRTLEHLYLPTRYQSVALNNRLIRKVGRFINHDDGVGYMLYRLCLEESVRSTECFKVVQQYEYYVKFNATSSSADIRYLDRFVYSIEYSKDPLWVHLFIPTFFLSVLGAFYLYYRRKMQAIMRNQESTITEIISSFQSLKRSNSLADEERKDQSL